MAPDRFSGILTSILLKVMGVRHVNIFEENLENKVGCPGFANEVLDKLNVSRVSKGYNVPQHGGFIIVVPVYSGIMEVVVAISEIIEKSERNDIKLLYPSQLYNLMDPFSPYLLKTETDSKFAILKEAISYLQSGGGLVYFARFHRKTTLFGNDRYESQIIEVPYKLAKYTDSAFIPFFVDFDRNIKYIWSTQLGSWWFELMSIRRFFSEAGSDMAIYFGKLLYDLLGCSCREVYRSIVSQYKSVSHFQKTNRSSSKLVSVLKRMFVPRGTLD